MKIEFRCKNKENNEWVYGDLMQLHDGRKYIVNNKFGACIDDKGNFINTEYPFVCEVNPNTVGQFTGLFDDNGDKIYDGDIVEIHNIKETKTSYKSEVYFTCNGVLVNGHPFHEKLGLGKPRLLSEFCNYGDGELFDVKCRIIGNKFD